MKFASIFLLCARAAPALAADSPASGAAGGAAASPPAVQIAGFVSPMQGIGICNDGATHLIHSASGDFRLKAANPEAAKALAQVANGKERVVLSGHRITGPECVYFSVERVGHTVPQ